MNPKLKKAFSALLIFGVPVVVLLIGLRSGDLAASMRALKQANPAWLVGGAVCMLGFFLFGGLSIRSALKRQGYGMSVWNSSLVSVTCEFYCNVTPGASGGQPMQIYRMYRQGIPVGVATAASVTHFVGFQFMIFLLSTVLGVAYWPFLKEQVGVNMPFLAVGYALNTAATFLVLVLCFVKSPVRWLISGVVKLGAKLRIIKDPETTRERWRASTDTFYASMRILRGNVPEILRQMLFCGAQVLAMMSVEFFVHRGLGLTGFSYPKITMMALMEFMSAAYAPLPGASGAREGVFSLYFDRIFYGDSFLAGLLIWRFITFYFSLMVGAAVITLGNVGGLKGGAELEAAQALLEKEAERQKETNQDE